MHSTHSAPWRSPPPSPSSPPPPALLCPAGSVQLSCTSTLPGALSVLSAKGQRLDKGGGVAAQSSATAPCPKQGGLGQAHPHRQHAAQEERLAWSHRARQHPAAAAAANARLRPHAAHIIHTAAQLCTSHTAQPPWSLACSRRGWGSPPAPAALLWPWPAWQPGRGQGQEACGSSGSMAMGAAPSEGIWRRRPFPDCHHIPPILSCLITWAALILRGASDRRWASLSENTDSPSGAYLRRKPAAKGGRSMGLGAAAGGGLAPLPLHAADAVHRRYNSAGEGLAHNWQRCLRCLPCRHSCTCRGPCRRDQ